MTTDLTPVSGGISAQLPALISSAGPKARKRFLEFFTAQIRNPNTRAAYARATWTFLAFLEELGFTELDQVEPIHVAAYIEKHPGSRPTVKQHLGRHSNTL